MECICVPTYLNVGAIATAGVALPVAPGAVLPQAHMLPPLIEQDQAALSAPDDNDGAHGRPPHPSPSHHAPRRPEEREGPPFAPGNSGPPFPSEGTPRHQTPPRIMKPISGGATPIPLQPLHVIPMPINGGRERILNGLIAVLLIALFAVSIAKWAPF